MSYPWVLPSQVPDPANEAGDLIVPPPSAPLPPPRGNEGLEGWARIAQLVLAMTVVLSCVQLLWTLSVRNRLAVETLQPSASAQELSVLAVQIVVVPLAQILVQVVGTCFLLVWIGIAHADRHHNRALLRHTTSGAVVGWVLPFVRVPRSLHTLTDLWQASDPTRAGDKAHTSSRAAPPLVLAYWLLRWFAPSVGVLVSLRQLLDSDWADRMRDGFLALMLYTGFYVASTICLIVVITRVTDQLRGRPVASRDETPPVAASLMRA